MSVRTSLDHVRHEPSIRFVTRCKGLLARRCVRASFKSRIHGRSALCTKCVKVCSRGDVCARLAQSLVRRRAAFYHEVRKGLLARRCACAHRLIAYLRGAYFIHRCDLGLVVAVWRSVRANVCLSRSASARAGRDVMADDNANGDGPTGPGSTARGGHAGRGHNMADPGGRDNGSPVLAALRGRARQPARG